MLIDDHSKEAEKMLRAVRSRFDSMNTEDREAYPVQVKGYTCDIGGKKFNDRLAMDRARAVAGIIEKNGITPVAVSGECKCCYVSEDKALNRRVEILSADVR